MNQHTPLGYVYPITVVPSLLITTIPPRFWRYSAFALRSTSINPTVTHENKNPNMDIENASCFQSPWPFWFANSLWLYDSFLADDSHSFSKESSSEIWPGQVWRQQQISTSFLYSMRCLSPRPPREWERFQNEQTLQGDETLLKITLTFIIVYPQLFAFIFRIVFVAWKG